MPRFPRVIQASLLLLCTWPARPARAQLGPPTSGGAVVLDQARRMLGHNRRLLVIGAHPDDEDTELLALSVRSLGAEAAYLSLNRGEGGQNSIGPELGEALGVLRTGELLAARQVDGARQFFTRAYDFGFSKSLDDTWKQWPRDSVLKDVVRVIRAFRPQVVVSVFSGTPRDGHGQHQAAGWAAREAFRIAGDSTRFPELQRELGLRPWTPVKFYRSTRFDTASTTLVLDGGAVDRAEGQTYHQLAMRSRSRHRSQDMGQLQTVGPSAVRLQLIEDRSGSGASALFAGTDTSLTSPLVGATEQDDQRRHQARARAAEAGLLVDALADDDRLRPGAPLRVVLTVANVPADARGVKLELLPRPGLQVTGDGLARQGDVASRTVTVRIDQLPAWAQPYFLHEPRDGNLYRWPKGEPAASLPFEPPPLVARATITMADGTDVPVDREVTFRLNRRSGGGEERLPVQVLPAVDVRADVPAAVWPLSAETHVVRAVATYHGTGPWRGRARVEVPTGWTAPAPIDLAFEQREERRELAFSVTVPARTAPGRFALRIVAEGADGERFAAGLERVEHDHVRARTWLVPAEMRVSLATLALPPLRAVGYVRGTADRVPEALRAAGVTVVEIDSAGLASARFAAFDAIVVGPRAYESVAALPAASAALRAFAEGGGTVLVQYQQPPYAASGAAPYPFVIAGDRVTEEDAAVTLRDSTGALLGAPNRIGAADWEGWVQERGLQFARTWDAHWDAPLRMHDTGEPDRDGSLLVARVGKGAYVYSGLSFFRQLPAGVPGAMRLFVNLLARARGAGPAL